MGKTSDRAERANNYSSALVLGNSRSEDMENCELALVLYRLMWQQTQKKAF